MTFGRTTAGLTIHDVTFAGAFAGSLYGPFDAPPIDAVRAVVRDLAERYPEHPAFCRPEIGRFGRGRWVPVSAGERERRCREMVLELDPADLDAALSRATRPLDDGRLLEYSVGPHHVVTRRLHILGDGTVVSLLPHVFDAAITGAPLPDLRARSVSMPLTRALVHEFGRHPRRLVETLREPRPRPTPPSAAVVDLGRHYDAFGRTATAETMQSLRAWRDTHEPDVSMGNVIAAAIRRAFDDAGVKFASPGLRMLVNGRRYLPPGTPVEGNFATAIYVEPDDPRSPRAVDDVIRRNLDIGRPLATLVASSIKNFVAPPSATRTPAGSLATLTISNLGPRRGLGVLPSHAFCEYRGVAEPEPGGLTVLLAQVGDCLSASATFEPAVADRASVAAAIDRLTRDPIGLFEKG
jgi:hypothetical protein